MTFRKFMLDDYLDGREGRGVLDFFVSFEEHFRNRKTTADFYGFVSGISSGEGYARPAFEDNDGVFTVNGGGYDSFEAFRNDMQASLRNPLLCRKMQECIPLMSSELFARYPDFAFPYLFPRHYYKLDVICREYGIELPDLPSALDHVAMFAFYFDVCEAMRRFRIELGLSPYELCAFVYGYALRTVGVLLEENKLRDKRIYMVYGNEGDREVFLDHGLDASCVTSWQGSPHIQPGDIVLLYERQPVSGFSSIWTAMTPGFIDPFFSRSETVYIGKPVAIPVIKVRELAEHSPSWRNSSAYRAHMQNQWKAPCTVLQYKELLEAIGRVAPDFDIGTLPAAPKVPVFDETDLQVEHDVEVQLLEPLLRRIGFSEEEWTTQYSVRVGRANRSRPDYVIHLDTAGTWPRAAFVFEAKLSVPSKHQLQKDFGQAVAYADLLHARVAALVAREGLWVCPRISGDFSYSEIKFHDWAELREESVIDALRVMFDR